MTWIGGSDEQHSAWADAPTELAMTSNPASSPPHATLLAFISLLVAPLLFRAEPVAETADRVNQPRSPVDLELLPDARDVHLERVGLWPSRDRPHRFPELRVRHELAAAPHQRREDAELDAGQAQPAPTPGG